MQAPQPDRDWSELDALVQQVLDGDLSADHKLRLADLLRDDRDAQQYYWQLTTLHACLQFEHASSLAELASEPIPERLPREAAVDPLRAAAASAVPTRGMGLRLLTTPLGFSLFTATICFLSFVLTTAQIPMNFGSGADTAIEPVQRADQAGSFAQLGSSVNSRWAAGGSDWKRGTKFAAGQVLQLAEGLAEVRLRNGALLLLQGPASVALDSDRRIKLTAGRLVARVPVAARGFAIDTPGGSVVDLGTEFGVVVNERREMEVHVFVGAVEVYAQQAGTAPRRLVGGQAIRAVAESAASRDAILQPIDLAERHFARSVQGSDIAFRPKESLEATLSQDTGLLIYYGPSSAEGTTVKNLSRTGPAYDGRLLGGQWREPQEAPTTRVLHMEKVADGIAFQASDSLTAFTLIARVRIDDAALRQPYIGLTMCPSWRHAPDMVHWQIEAAKTLCFAVSGIQMPKVELTSAQLIGRWVHLAVTCDQARGRIVHYVDAQPVAEHRGLQLPTAQFGEAWIGNWNPAGYPYPGAPRNLTGELAEFMLFRRALSAEQIDYLYRGGKSQSPAADPQAAIPQPTAHSPDLEPTRFVK